MGYIYLLLSVDCDGNELYKIGVTKRDIKKRLLELQTGNPNQISILKYYESKEHRRIEQWLHGKYSLKKTLAQNEWFKLDDTDVIDFIDECKKAEATFNLLKDNPFFK